MKERKPRCYIKLWKGQQTYNICQGTDERKKATLLYKVVKRTTNLQYMTGDWWKKESHIVIWSCEKDNKLTMYARGLMKERKPHCYIKLWKGQHTYNIWQGSEGTDERKKATLLYTVVKRTTNLQYMTGGWWKKESHIVI